MMAVKCYKNVKKGKSFAVNFRNFREETSIQWRRMAK